MTTVTRKVEVTRKVAWVDGRNLRTAERLAVRSRGFVEVGRTEWSDGEVEGRYPFCFEYNSDAKSFAKAVEASNA